MGPPPVFFFFPMLLMLLFWGVPLFFVVRWAIRVRQALENRTPPADLPSREQVAALTDQVESLVEEIERLRERQDFVEHLLQAPRGTAARPTGTPPDRSDSA